MSSDSLSQPSADPAQPAAEPEGDPEARRQRRLLMLDD
jgi:hypothetical protein